jgi:hypothetical protein
MGRNVTADGQGFARVEGGKDQVFTVCVGEWQIGPIYHKGEAHAMRDYINEAHLSAVQEAVKDKDEEIARLKNGIEHFQRVAGLPASNGQVRKAVREFAEKVKREMFDCKCGQCLKCFYGEDFRKMTEDFK